MKKDLMIIADYSQQEMISLQEVCEICQVDPETIRTLVTYAVVEPIQQQDWRFQPEHLQRIQKALRLQHDLELNAAGVALVLDLLQEMRALRAKLSLFEKHY